MLGLVGGSTQWAYPLSRLATAPVTNDLLGGTLLVITHDPSSGAAAAFSRSANGRTLTFQPTELPSGGIAMTDEQTGSIWDLFSGQALEGPSAGHRLEPVAAPISFWFPWSDFYPDTEVYIPYATPCDTGYGWSSVRRSPPVPSDDAPLIPDRIGTGETLDGPDGIGVYRSSQRELDRTDPIRRVFLPPWKDRPPLDLGSYCTLTWAQCISCITHATG